MAVDTWAAEIDKTVWHLYKVCSCGGVLKHKYWKIANHSEELWILPNRKQYQRRSAGKITKAGPIEEISLALSI